MWVRLVSLAALVIASVSLSLGREVRTSGAAPRRTSSSALPSVVPASTSAFGFEAVADTGWNPGDPHLAAGPEHLVLIGNGMLAFFEKNGRRTFFQNIAGKAGFWGSVGSGDVVFDPEAHWDSAAKRFFVFANERGGTRGGAYFVLAVSDDADPNGKWHKYRFDVTQLASGADIDGPNIGIDAQAVYMSADFIGGGKRYFVYVVDKASVLAGRTPKVTKSFIDFGTVGYGLPVVHGRAPAMYMIESFSAATNRFLGLHAITDPLGSAKRAFFNLAVPAYGRAVPATQKNTAALLHTLDTRVWSATWRNGSLWACQHHGDPMRARWYEIRTNGWPTSGRDPTLVQSGDIAVGNGAHAFQNSIGVDADGNALMVFATSGPNDFLSIGRAWRAAADPRGTMRPVVKLKSAKEPYTRGRWGDYSSVSADPVRENVMWFVHKFAPKPNTWSTWIGQKTLAPLGIDVEEISSNSGGTATLALDRPRGARAPYLILATASGTSPGFRFGGARVPINIDAFTILGLDLVTTAAFAGFGGVLDDKGCATARFAMPPVRALRDRTLHFAFLQASGTSAFASNAVALAVGP